MAPFQPYVRRRTPTAVILKITKVIIAIIGHKTRKFGRRTAIIRCPNAASNHLIIAIHPRLLSRLFAVAKPILHAVRQILNGAHRGADKIRKDGAVPEEIRKNGAVPEEVAIGAEIGVNRRSGSPTKMDIIVSIRTPAITTATI